jgi:hypothetical protein
MTGPSGGAERRRDQALRAPAAGLPGGAVEVAAVDAERQHWPAAVPAAPGQGPPSGTWPQSRAQSENALQEII